MPGCGQPEPRDERLFSRASKGDLTIEPFVFAEPSVALTEVFGHADFRPGQRAVIEHLLAGPDRAALLLMPTGMGKSLCYQVPALCLPGMTLVISPLIALMQDQVAALRARGVAAAALHAALGRHERERELARAVAGELKLLYVTPERFRQPAFREAIALVRQTVGIPLLAVDEAHCISQWGHDFRPDYSRVGPWRAWLGKPRTIALTATATPAVQADIRQQLQLDELPAGRLLVAAHGIARPNLDLAVTACWGEDERLAQVERLLRETHGSAIVYFTLIQTLERFADHCERRGLPLLRYHGKLESRRRRALQQAFMTTPDARVLATNAFGMGIDKPDIRLIVHAELPDSLEAYYQEIGRAGRDGRPARAVLLYDSQDLATQMEFLRWAHPDAHFYQRLHHHLQHDAEPIQAFGADWLREKLHAKRGRHDRRLETAWGMLERHGVIEADPREPAGAYRLVEPEAALPAALRDADLLAERLRAAQLRLHDLVRYANETADTPARRAFLATYFGVSD